MSQSSEDDFMSQPSEEELFLPSQGAAGPSSQSGTRTQPSQGGARSQQSQSGASTQQCQGGASTSQGAAVSGLGLHWPGVTVGVLGLRVTDCGQLLYRM